MTNPDKLRKLADRLQRTTNLIGAIWTECPPDTLRQIADSYQELVLLLTAMNLDGAIADLTYAFQRLKLTDEQIEIQLCGLTARQQALKAALAKAGEGV